MDNLSQADIDNNDDRFPEYENYMEIIPVKVEKNGQAHLDLLNLLNIARLDLLDLSLFVHPNEDVKVSKSKNITFFVSNNNNHPSLSNSKSDEDLTITEAKQLLKAYHEKIEEMKAAANATTTSYQT